MDKIKTENTETEILIAAKEIFQQKGMAGARMQEIADKAKINKALLHYYYRSKQLLFEAVFKSAFSLLAPQLNKVLNDDSDLFEKIRKFTENYVSFVIKHPYLPNFVIQELNKNPEFVQKLRSEKNFPSIEKFKLQVSDAINQGIIKPIEAEQLFINIISLNIFPFIGEPLLMALVNVDKESYNKILENRKTEVAEFIINSIKI
ncbi:MULTISPECIES: TetR/AcrR family transcriptional regulator [Flavobacterium]|jgi:AcrR family transcriptional regulator|uniref:TetR/AcrR family transcriptional regulator n=1 Tax=Flavobacterium TaxID=237 RepID=UPI001B6E7589|nr:MULTISPECIES: TetR/AcrR family transcriptional regulator [Flavobacterium]MBP6585982.1 TetR/AcrR family transcriptional regulator [Flavobacterium sp.]MCU4188879.1 TetR/AcrR family transcriptional regulator [Flavobacterium sp. HXWNR29]UGS21626.1 TetR/AcrR family transcriptional regulator [Flavobacterium cyclinae]HQV36866.1 TetR/AcrR family transcriptional regulator [Flavobacterium sp.]